MFWNASKSLLALNRITITVFLLLVLFSVQSQVLFNNLEDSVHSSHWIGLQTIVSGNAYSGSHYSLVDSQNPFGLGTEQLFPEAIQGKNVWLKISGWLKSEVAFDEAVFVVTLKNGHKDILWKGIDLGKFIHEKNDWNYFIDSLPIPANFSVTATLKAYLWNSDGKNKLGLDDLKFTFLPMNGLSFLPDLTKKALVSLATNDLIFENSYYKIYFDKATKAVQIKGKNDTLIAEDIAYYREYYQKKNRSKTQLPLLFKKRTDNDKYTELVFKVKDASTEVKLICQTDNPEIKFHVTSKYKRNQELIRQSLLLKSGQEVEEVYRKNRKSDWGDFQEEYWLDKEGVRFGKNENSLIIYHTTELSSMQLKASARLLILNLDYEKDHPFLHFPLNNSTIDLKEDWSTTSYSKTSRRQYSFSIFAGTKARNLPRFMKNPEGYLATYIWTEHADWTDMRTNRATFFGSENISLAEKATGGFVYYNIPVTKSVFWDNPDQISNTEVSGGIFNGLESTIQTDSAFHTFLDQLQKHGHEICLHTPEQFTTNPGRLEKALNFMQNNYGSPSWIDHGYNNKTQNNREDLVCDGSLDKSTYFSLDLWKKYGVKYLWNPFYEEFGTFSNLQFSNMLEKPYSGYGDAIPSPDYWQHFSRTAKLYHWPTSSVLFIPSQDLWSYHFNNDVLDHFIQDWAVEINHCYPAWVDPAKGFWVWNQDGEIVAATGFNQALARMAKLRDDGLLNVTTIRDFMDYRTAIDILDYEVLANGEIRITNKSSQEIDGLSFATHSRFLLVDGLGPSQKVVGEDLIFWFDLNAGESKIIRVFE